MEAYYQRKYAKYKEKYNKLRYLQQIAGNKDESEDEKERKIEENMATFMTVPPLS